MLTSTFARWLYAIPFGIFGLMHFMAAGDMAGMVPLPGGIFWVYLTGAALIAASVSFIIEKQTRLAGLLLALMLAIFAFTIHLPSLMGGDQMAMSSMLKDLALAGAALFIAGQYGDSSE
ncbi:MAG: DoxX family protein [Balneolaceae bacterium]